MQRIKEKNALQLGVGVGLGLRMGDKLAKVEERPQTPPEKNKRRLRSSVVLDNKKRPSSAGGENGRCANALSDMGGGFLQEIEEFRNRKSSVEMAEIQRAREEEKLKKEIEEELEKDAAEAFAQAGQMELISPATKNMRMLGTLVDGVMGSEKHEEEYFFEQPTRPIGGSASSSAAGTPLRKSRALVEHNNDKVNKVVATTPGGRRGSVIKISTQRNSLGPATELSGFNMSMHEILDKELKKLDGLDRVKEEEQMERERTEREQEEKEREDEPDAPRTPGKGDLDVADEYGGEDLENFEASRSGGSVGVGGGEKGRARASSAAGQGKLRIQVGGGNIARARSAAVVSTPRSGRRSPTPKHVPKSISIPKPHQKPPSPKPTTEEEEEEEEEEDYGDDDFEADDDKIEHI